MYTFLLATFPASRFETNRFHPLFQENPPFLRFQVEIPFSSIRFYFGYVCGTWEGACFAQVIMLLGDRYVTVNSMHERDILVKWWQERWGWFNPICHSNYKMNWHNCRHDGVGGFVHVWNLQNCDNMRFWFWNVCGIWATMCKRHWENMEIGYLKLKGFNSFKVRNCFVLEFLELTQVLFKGGYEIMRNYLFQHDLAKFNGCIW